MQLASHLRLTRCGVYQYRLVLPANVAALLGQQVMLKSLQTKRPDHARLTAYALSAKIVPLLRRMRRVLAIDPNSIDPKSVRELILGNLTITHPDGTVVDFGRVETSDDPVKAAEELRTIERLTSPAKPLLPISDAGAAELLSLREELAAITAAGMQKTAKAPSKPSSIKDASKAFMGFKNGTAGSTKKVYERRLKVFAMLAGGEEQMLHEITSEQCVDIGEALNIFPCYGRNQMDAKTLLDNPPAGKVLDATTAKDYLILWKDFFQWAIDTKRYVGDNPVADIPRPSEGNGGGGAEAFLQSELETIFKPSHFADMKRPYQFWGPLFGLFTGARSNEIAQLRVRDITREAGVLCMSITHEPRADVPTRTKNETSIRTLPLHPKLLEIGFEDYWEDMKAVGTQRLFGLAAGDDGKCERYMSRDFNEGLLIAIGVHKYRKKTFHSFRDTCANALGKNNVWGPYIDQWLGHSPSTVQGKHYASALTSTEVVDQAFPALNYRFLDLSEIRYEKGRWNDWVAEQLKPKKPRRKPVEQPTTAAGEKSITNAAPKKPRAK
jgi:integrase